MSSSNKEKTEYEKILKKYSMGKFNLSLPEKSWREILLKGNIDKTTINEILNNSKYLMDEHTESWQRLWHYRDLEDVEFKIYLQEVEEKFDKNEYKDQGILLHVVALLLYFSKAKMYNVPIKSITSQAKKNIRDCIKSEKWDKIEYDIDFGGSAYGLGFFERESENMQNILKYFKKEIEKSFSEQLKEKANELSEDFKNNNLENLEKKLQYEFYEVPILSKIDIDDFVSMFQQLEHKNIYDIAQIIKKRYSINNDLEEILSEEKFWKSVNNRILKGIDINNNPVKYNLLENFKSYIIKEILEKFKTERNHLKILKEQQSKSI